MWPNMTHSLARFPRKIPKLLGTIMYLLEGVKCVNREDVTLSWKDPWKFGNLPESSRMGEKRVEWNFEIYASLVFSENGLQFTHAAFHFVAGSSLMISRWESKRRLLFFSIPSNTPFSLSFIVKHDRKQYAGEISSLSFDGKKIDINSESPYFNLDMSLAHPTAYMARFLVMEEVLVDVPCLLHVC